MSDEFLTLLLLTIFDFLLFLNELQLEMQTVIIDNGGYTSKIGLSTNNDAK